jgi:signal transduction histidine kinase
MMENLINDLLDLAKMENNSFSFSNDYFNLANIVYEAF